MRVSAVERRLREKDSRIHDFRFLFHEDNDLKTLIASGLFFMVTVTAGQAHAGMIFQANLSGDQEVPSVTTTASGTASLVLNDAMDRLEMNLQLFGLDLDGFQTPDDSDDDVAGLHIHSAPAGNNGPAVFGLISPNSDTNNDLLIDAGAGTVFSAWDINEGFDTTTTLGDQLLNLMDAQLDLNVHTSVYLGGEIRGQIQQVPLPSSLALLGLGLAAMAAGAWRRDERSRRPE